MVWFGSDLVVFWCWYGGVLVLVWLVVVWCWFGGGLVVLWWWSGGGSGGGLVVVWWCLGGGLMLV